MKLHTDVNEVTLSNVSDVGEFKITNSVKAFKILSDGLYSNKIKAIVRELSCNAVDSHVAAGKPTEPFEVHLPTTFEPWFSVKDFGTGLDGNEIENIYTTYFESTKTNSDDYIGALGLGSKSPFAYTENFTVTAVKNGIKRIYSAFINGKGIPSITKMNEELVDESNGVEIKFSVVNSYDYQSFRREAIEVFKWFKVKPTITGVSDVTLSDPDYAEKNIVPGVHLLKGGASYALMGNIPYSIDNYDNRKKFGDLSEILNSSIVIEFNIGELDFAASREHLSYVSYTIDNIKKKLEVINNGLVDFIKFKVEKIDNDWLKSIELTSLANNYLFRNAVKKYVNDTGFKIFDNSIHNGRYQFSVDQSYLDDNKLSISYFTRSGTTYSNGSPSRSHDKNGKLNTFYKIPVDSGTYIILNDLKIGTVSRAKYHFNNITGIKHPYIQVYCITYAGKDTAERDKAYDDFIKSLNNPPNVIKSSQLLEKEKVKSDRQKESILFLHNTYIARKGYEFKWKNYDEELDNKKTYYYVELNRFEHTDSKGNIVDVPRLAYFLKNCGIKELSDIVVFGVRKSVINDIKAKKNWVSLEKKIKDELNKLTDSFVEKAVTAGMVDTYPTRVYINTDIIKFLSDDSFYKKFYKKYKENSKKSADLTSLFEVCNRYGKTYNVEKIKESFNKDRAELYAHYELLDHISHVDDTKLLNYIKLIDKTLETKND